MSENAPLPSDPALTQMTAFAEYSIDDGRANLLYNSGFIAENGTSFMWGGVRPGMLDPVPSDAKEITFTITQLNDRQGQWEFKIPLK